MVLQRSPKAYKLLMRTMLTQLVEYESIITTAAKAKHLMPKARKLLAYAERAANKEPGPVNKLQGRVTTTKAKDKLLLEIVPRLRNFKQKTVTYSRELYRRRGDNTSMVRLSIAGNDKDIARQQEEEEMIRKGNKLDVVSVATRILSQEREYYEKLITQKPQLAQLLVPKIKQVEFEMWEVTKDKKEPCRIVDLV